MSRNNPSTTTGKIARQVTQLNSAAASNDGTARIQLDTALDQLEKETKALAAQLVPGNRVPLYISPQSDQSRLDYTTWNEFDPTGPYGGYDDNYCRPVPNSGKGNVPNNQLQTDSVYPVRNPSNGTVTMEPCTELLGPEVKKMANIKDALDRLYLVAKHHLLTEEAGSANSMKQTRETAEGKIEEYERATRQYQRLSEMIDSFQEISQRHNKIINRTGVDVNDETNNVAVMQDNMEVYLAEKKMNEERNRRLLKWSRMLLGVLWVITLALFLLKQI